MRTVHVPYRGNGPAVADLLAGQVNMMWSSAPPVMDHIRDGRLRLLGLGNASRVEQMPEVPTVAESGLPGFEAYSWVGLVATAGTPAEIVARLNAEVRAFLALPETRARLQAQGMIPAPTTPEEFGAFIAAEMEKWGAVVRAAGIKPG